MLCTGAYSGVQRLQHALRVGHRVGDGCPHLLVIRVVGHVVHLEAAVEPDFLERLEDGEHVDVAVVERTLCVVASGDAALYVSEMGVKDLSLSAPLTDDVQNAVPDRLDACSDAVEEAAVIAWYGFENVEPALRRKLCVVDGGIRGVDDELDVVIFCDRNQPFVHLDRAIPMVFDGERLQRLLGDALLHSLAVEAPHRVAATEYLLVPAAERRVEMTVSRRLSHVDGHRHERDIELAKDFDKGGFVDKAIETYQDVLKINRDQEEVVLSLCKIYEDLEDWEQAYNYRITLSKIGRKSQSETISHILVQKAKSYFEKGDVIKCDEDLEEAFRHAPSVSAKILRLKLYLTRVQVDLAKSLLFELLQENPVYASFIFVSLEEGFKGKSFEKSPYQECMNLLREFFLKIKDKDLAPSPSIMNLKADWVWR